MKFFLVFFIAVIAIQSTNVFGTLVRNDLLSSVEKNDFERTKYLLENGANIDAVDKNGKTALHLSAINGKVEILKLLLEYGANIDACDNLYITALHYSVDNGHFKISNLLLSFGANIDAVDGYGLTAFHYSVDKGHFKISKLLNDYGANIDTVDNCGYNSVGIFIALHKNTRDGHYEVLETLQELNDSEISKLFQEADVEYFDAEVESQGESDENGSDEEECTKYEAVGWTHLMVLRRNLLATVLAKYEVTYLMISRNNLSVKVLAATFAASLLLMFLLLYHLFINSLIP